MTETLVDLDLEPEPATQMRRKPNLFKRYGSWWCMVKPVRMPYNIGHGTTECAAYAMWERWEKRL